jgi:hypothetical protein
MKNIQVIDGAINCKFEIYSIPEENFELIFPDGQDIEFVEDFYFRNGDENANKILRCLWDNKVKKSDVDGIHGTLFYGLKDDKYYFYPTKKESEMIQGVPDW